MKKRKIIAAKKQKLAVHHNEELLGKTFVSDICFTISDYLMPVELVALYFTCGYFYRTHVLEKSFCKHLEWFPETKQEKKKGIPTTSFELIKKRIDRFANLSLNGEEFYKQIIKRWLLIDQRRFNNNSNLLLDEEVCIVKSYGARSSEAKVNAYQFFSYIGAVEHMLIMHEYINNGRLERKLLEKDGFFAFRLAASRGNVCVLKLLWQLMDYDTNVKEKLLASRAYIDGFIDAAASHNLSTLRLLIIFAGGEEPFRKRFLIKNVVYHGNRDYEYLLSAFSYAATHGDVDVVNLLLELIGVEDVSYFVTKRKGRLFSDTAKAGHADILKLLWGTVGHKESKRDLLGSERHFIFYRAAEGGHVEVVKLLLQFADECHVLCAALTTKKCEAFRVAAFCGHIDVVKLFLEKNIYLVRWLLMAKNYYAFFSAARNGHVETARLLWELISHDNYLKHKLLLSDNYRAFRVDKMFDIITEQGLEFNVDEAFKHSPGLKRRYHNFLDNSDSQISVCSSKATLFNKGKTIDSGTITHTEPESMLSNRYG